MIWTGWMSDTEVGGEYHGNWDHYVRAVNASEALAVACFALGKEQSFKNEVEVCVCAKRFADYLSVIYWCSRPSHKPLGIKFLDYKSSGYGPDNLPPPDFYDNWYSWQDTEHVAQMYWRNPYQDVRQALLEHALNFYNRCKDLPRVPVEPLVRKYQKSRLEEFGSV